MIGTGTNLPVPSSFTQPGNFKMATAEQIRANLGAASSHTVAAANVNPAASRVPGAATGDQVMPAPSAEAISAEAQITALQAQLAQALGIIATLSPAAVAAVEGERTYHSNVPFVKIQVMKGPGICEPFQFRAHKLTTDDPHAIAFLEAAIRAGNSGFSHAPIPKTLSAEEVEMRADVRKAAVTARDKMVAAGESVA